MYMVLKFAFHVRGYAAHQLRDCFDKDKLDLGKVARSFGLEVAPFVDLNVSGGTKAGDRRKADYGVKIGGSHAAQAKKRKKFNK